MEKIEVQHPQLRRHLAEAILFARLEREVRDRIFPAKRAETAVIFNRTLAALVRSYERLDRGMAENAEAQAREMLKANYTPGLSRLVSAAV